MIENKEIMAYLEQISGQISEVKTRIDDVEKKLNARIDSVEKNLNARIDSLDVKIDSVEKNLNAKIDMVYHIACENRENIKEMRREIDELLIPYNDRNLFVNEQISKISELEAWKEEAEKVIGNHSEAIRRLQGATA